MLTLSDEELQAMRDELDDSLPDTCTISRYTTVADGAGGQTDTWATLATSACRISPEFGRDSESEQGDREVSIKDWVVTLPAETTIAPRDRLISAAVTYEVVAVDGLRSWEISRRVHTQKVT